MDERVAKLKTSNNGRQFAENAQQRGHERWPPRRPRARELQAVEEGHQDPSADRHRKRPVRRGRQQAVMEFNGGAKSSGGYSRNAINGINPLLRGALVALAEAEFGRITVGGPANRCICN